MNDITPNSNPTNPPEAPLQVRKALQLWWATLALGIFRSSLEFSNVVRHPLALGGGLFGLMVIALVFLLIGLLYYQVGQGKNWARILNLILLVGGTLPALKGMLAELGTAPFSTVLGFVQLGMDATAMVLIFKPESNEWFRKMKQHRAQENP